MEKNLKEIVGFDPDEIFESSFLLEHIYIGLQQKSSESIEKGYCEFEGIESYLYLMITNDEGQIYTIKVTPALLEKVDVSSKRAWEHAAVNTDSQVEIRSMESYICEMMNVTFLGDEDSAPAMYIVTNKSHIRGAASILCFSEMYRFAKEKGFFDWIILPSSIHEVILVPAYEDMDISVFDRMVNEVNEVEVIPKERLSDRAYRLNLMEGNQRVS